MSTGTAIARIGTSGWMYRAWRGVVYPRDLAPKAWFAHYAERFDTVELNTTFYRLPSRTAVEAWADAAPAGFEYACKLGAFGSHRKKLLDAGTWLPNHLDRVRRLGPSMGPTVVQLPPRWRRDLARLDEFLAVAGELGPDVRWAVEFRDPSWIGDATFETLRRHSAALVVHDLIEDHPIVLTAGWTYLRFHGPDTLTQPYQGRYGEERLRPWADRVGAWLACGVDVRAFFNNDIGGHAVADARTLRRLVDVYAAGSTGAANPCPAHRRRRTANEVVVDREMRHGIRDVR
jgi:uncharacterized protein YecE (DUF72 family)